MLQRYKNQSLDTSKSADNLDGSHVNRFAAIARIWAIAALMLLSCAAAMLGHSENAIWAIVIGAIVGTAAVLGVFNSRSHPARLPPPENLKEINERLANVETIVSYEEKISAAKSRLETASE